MTATTVYESIADNLREFGYPGVTAQMIEDTHKAVCEGKSRQEMPHGIVGQFAYSQINDAIESGWLARLTP